MQKQCLGHQHLLLRLILLNYLDTIRRPFQYQLNEQYIYIHTFDAYLLHVSVLVHLHHGGQLRGFLEKPTTIVTFSFKENQLDAQFTFSIFHQTPVHVSGVSIAHHQEVHHMDTTIGTYCSF